MKRTMAIFALILAAAMLLAGCKKEPLPAVYTVYSYGAPYTIDTEGRTISDGTYTYGYEYAASGSSVSFTYPDGNVYSAGIQSANSSGAGGVSAGSVSAMITAAAIPTRFPCAMRSPPRVRRKEQLPPAAIIRLWRCCFAALAYSILPRPRQAGILATAGALRTPSRATRQ